MLQLDARESTGAKYPRLFQEVSRLEALKALPPLNIRHPISYCQVKNAKAIVKIQDYRTCFLTQSKKV